MKVRPKLFLLIFGIAFASLLLVCVFGYWQNSRAIESSLRNDLRRNADWIALRINFALSERETGLVMLARTSALREYLQRHPSLPGKKAVEADQATSKVSENTVAEVPEALQAAITAFLLENQEYYSSIGCLNIESRPLFRAQIAPSDGSQPNRTSSVTFQTQNLPANSGPEGIGGDINFKNARHDTPLRQLIEGGPLGPTVRYTAPVLANESAVVLGALVVDLKLDQLFKEHTSDVVGALNGAPTGMQTSRMVVVLHEAGRIYYHSNSALSYQPIASAMPDFKPVAGAMMAGGSGVESYQSSNHDRWLAAYRPLGQMNLALAVTTDYTAALQPARRALLLNILFALLIAVLAALALALIAQRGSGSLARLTQGAIAIARGELDQELVVSSAENQPLADSMNIVTARLREQLAREVESRQFNTFTRLSAMLTHDLKNTITALSLGVSNMERNFDRPEFRADAMTSLKDATEKLQRLVRKLSEPVNTMSGEYHLPRSTDLVSLIQQVLNSISISNELHRIEIHLPETLFALVEPDRMEKVIENLVINSLEAMGANKGTLTIAGDYVNEGETVFFSISDTGPGISKDFQERRLFKAFATTKPAGVGLGLYTCREVVRTYGGSIEVDSEPGVGTTFRVVLPSGQPNGEHRAV